MSWLDEPWGHTSHGTKKQLLFALTAMLIATAIFDGLLSEALEAQIDPLFVTPLFLGSCAMFAACTMSTWIVMLIGGGADALIHTAREHTCQLALISITCSLSLVLYQVAGVVMSVTSTIYVYVCMPLVMPFTALCCERERPGDILYYGIWPCLDKNPPPAKQSHPLRYGVLPGLATIAGGAIVTVCRWSVSTTPLGMACAIGSLALQAFSLVSVAVLLGGDQRAINVEPGLRASLPIASIASAGALPILLLFSFLSDERKFVTQFVYEQPAAALSLYCLAGVSGGTATVLRFGIIQAASALTAAIVHVSALTLATFFASEAPSIVNIAGLVLLKCGTLWHAWYMHERQAFHANSRGDDARMKSTSAWHASDAESALPTSNRGVLGESCSHNREAAASSSSCPQVNESTSLMKGTDARNMKHYVR